MPDISIDRFRGALLGLAAGDALGTTLEFQAPGTFAPIADMVGGGPFRLKPGQWTDDTSMACAWQKASSKPTASMRPTRCAITCAGGARGIFRAQGAASTSATRPAQP